MEAHYTTPLGPFAPAIGAAFNTFTTRQDVSPLPLPILPANGVSLGTAFKVEAEGQWSATGTPTRDRSGPPRHDAPQHLGSRPVHFLCRLQDI